MDMEVKRRQRKKCEREIKQVFFLVTPTRKPVFFNTEGHSNGRVTNLILQRGFVLTLLYRNVVCLFVLYGWF